MMIPGGPSPDALEAMADKAAAEAQELIEIAAQRDAFRHRLNVACAALLLKIVDRARGDKGAA